MFPSIINKSVKGRFFSSLFLSNYLPILISIYPSIYSSFCRAFLSIKLNISLPVLQSSTLPWCRRTRRCSQGASGRAPSDLCLQIPRSPRVHRYQGTIWSIPQNQVNTTACLVFMRWSKESFSLCTNFVIVQVLSKPRTIKSVNLWYLTIFALIQF